MEKVRITLMGFWVALMLTYLLGDVLRIFAGDFTPGEMDGEPAEEWMWVVAMAFMLVPITMIALTLTVPFPAIKWIGFAASIFLILFNLAGLPYPGLYDNILIFVGFIFNGLIIWYSWTWS